MIEYLTSVLKIPQIALDEELKDMGVKLKEEKNKKKNTKPVKENIAAQMKLV